MIEEPEAGRTVIKQSFPESSCQFPDSAAFTDSEKINITFYNEIANCIEDRVNKAFDSIRGQQKDELTIAELRQIHEEKLANLEFDTDQAWLGLGGILSLFHPNGSQAVSKNELKGWLNWLRMNAGIISTWHRAVLDGRWVDDKEHIWNEVFNLIKHLSELISVKGEISFEEIQGILTEVNARTNGQLGEEQVWRARLHAVWTLKGMFVADPNKVGHAGNFSGSALKELIQLAGNVATDLGPLVTYIRESGIPNELPSNMKNLFEKVESRLTTYVETHHFTSLDTEQIQWAIRQLDPKSSTPELVPDLVRISQRLSPKGVWANGFHPRGLIRLFKRLPNIAEEIRQAGFDFNHCDSQDCSLTLRELLKAKGPSSEVALDGRVYSWGWQNTTKKRLDESIRWEDIVGRLASRGFIEEIFSAFDPDGDGITYTGKTSQDDEEVLDLAFAFLRLVAAGEGSQSKGEYAEQKVSRPIFIKPRAFAHIMGLVGDRWMPDGNRDGRLDANEVFSIVSIYQDVQDRSYPYFYSLDSYVQDTSQFPYPPLSELYYERREFIKTMSSPENFPVIHMKSSLERMPEEARQSLFHALVGVPDYSIEAYKVGYGTSSPPPSKILTQWARPSDTLAPVAVVYFLDRLMLLCDINEDNKLSWKELDCASPLLMEAGYQTISSELVNLNAGVHDGGKLVLSFLKQAGFPTVLAKLLLINGGIRSLNMNLNLEQILKNITLRLDSLDSLVAGPSSGNTELANRLWKIEAMKQYAHCDSNGDGVLFGKELDVFTDTVFDQIEETLKRVSEISSTQESVAKHLEALRSSSALRLGIVLAALTQESILQTLEEVEGMESDPVKILNLLEELIRRGRPL